jgi:hypothetical protein
LLREPHIDRLADPKFARRSGARLDQVDQLGALVDAVLSSTANANPSSPSSPLDS